MAAGTEGFIDTRKDGNHIGRVISTILEARQLAEDERKYAETQADKYQTSLAESGIERGYFFKKALRWKFGGEYKQKKIAQLNTLKTKGGLLKSALTGKSGQNKLDKFERTQVLFDMFKAEDKPKTFRDKFKPLYKGFVDDPMLRPRSRWYAEPSAAKKIQKATSKKKRVSKEDILDSLGAITESIQKIAESISEKNKVVAEQMIHSSVLQGMLHQELKTSNDSLEDKLQKIVNAISNQTKLQKDSVEKAKFADTENKLEERRKSASIENFDDLLTEEDESKIPATSAQDIEMQQMSAYEQNDVLKAEQGAKFVPTSAGSKVEMHGKEAVVDENGQTTIVSGPDSGYPVIFKGGGRKEIIPLDNNYTQGEPSAVDGKVRPKPTEPIIIPKSMPPNNIQKFEMGTNDKSSVSSAPITSKFGFDTARNIMGIAGGGTTEASKLTQSMTDVMSLPIAATGGFLLAATTNYMKGMAGEGAEIVPEIQKMQRNLTSVFDIPSAIVNATMRSTSKKSSTETTDGKEGESKKNIFAKLMDGFGAMLDKMKDSINTTPPPNPTGTAQPADISGNEKELLKRLMIAEAGGEGTEGMAMVGRSVLNRAGLVQSGKLGAGQFNAESGSVTDIIQAPLQYTPYAQGKLDRPLTAEENARAEAAYQLMMNDPEFRKAIKTKFNLSESDVKKAAAATGFRNYNAGAGVDTSQQVNEFVAGRHTFNTAGNAGLITPYSSATVAQPTPPPNPSPTGQLGQAITNNYGLKVGQERKFTVPGYGEVTAHKTTVGFDFFKNGRRLDVAPSNPQGKTIVDYFTSTNGGQEITPSPSSRQQIDQKVLSLSTPSSDGKSSGGGITVLNTGGSQEIASAGSSFPASGDMGIEAGVNQLSPFYSSSFSIGVS